MTESDVRSALSRVLDPEIRKPITELGMVKSVEIADDASVDIDVLLTIAGCPMRTEITDRVTKAVADVAGIGAIRVELDVMNDEQRTELRKSLRGDSAEPVIPFAQPGSLTRVYAVASGKGGVGKSSVTVNLAAAHGRPRPVGRRARRRHLRPLGAPHARHRRQADPGRADDHAAAGARREADLDRACSPRATPPSCGAGRCCTARCSSSSPTSSGATWTCCCSTCRRAPVTSRSPSPS